MSLVFRRFLFIAFICISIVPIFAQASRRTARLQYILGSASIQPHGSGLWVKATPDDPINISDNLWTEKDSRVEIGMGLGRLRLAPEASLTLVNNSVGNIQLRLHQGVANLHVRDLLNGEIYEIETANVVFTITKPGDYRLEVDPRADLTTITVWSGAGTATGERPAVRVRAKQQVRFPGTNAAFETRDVPNPDPFDEWCRVRDQVQDRYAPRPFPPVFIR